MPIETVIAELIKLLGPTFVSYLLRRFPDPSHLLSLLTNKNLIQRMKLVDVKSLNLEENNQRLAVAKSFYPLLEHPLTENLKRRRGNSNMEFLHGLFYENEVIGHQVTYPINMNCVNKFLRNEYKSGSDIKSNDVANTIENAAGIYIAYLISYQIKHRPLVMLRSEKFISEFIDKSKRKNIYIITKPSKNTYKKVKQLFVQTQKNLPQEDCIYFLNSNSLLSNKFGIIR